MLGLPENFLSSFTQLNGTANYSESESSLFQLDVNIKDTLNYSLSYDPLTCLKTVSSRRLATETSITKEKK